MKFRPPKGTSILEIDYYLWWKKTGDLFNQLIPYARTTAREIAVKALERVKYHTPDTYTGTDLRGMWEMDERKLKTREEFIIHNLYPEQKIIVFFEEGTKAHDIYPKNRPWLHFKTRNGRWIRTGHVSHPGTVAHKMIANTEDELSPLVDFYVQSTFEMAQRIMNQKSGGSKKA